MVVRYISVFLLIALAVFPVAAALADGPSPGGHGTDGGNKGDTTVTVSSGPDGVTIYITVLQSTPGSSIGLSQANILGEASGWSCSAHVINIGKATRSWFDTEAPLHPNQAPWMVRCPNDFSSIVWLPASSQPPAVNVVVDGGSIAPIDIAAEVHDYLPAPLISIEVNPGRGLVAMPSWFWIEGYDGGPLRREVTLGLAVLEVEVTAQSYRWSFGDGATYETTSLGQRYPSASDIQHIYEQSSFSAGGSFEVTVAVTFSVHYRVNGGPWETASPITRTYEAAYPVQQLQSVLTGGN